jgi:hypothetical protein
MGEEELHHHYEMAKALNIKHGINPKQFREQHAPFKQVHRRSRAKVTLPTISV